MQAHKPADYQAAPPPFLNNTLHPVRAIFFDIYGTLLLSARGEVGSNLRTVDNQRARYYTAWHYARHVCADERVRSIPTRRIVSAYRTAIQERHAMLNSMGIAHPEVDIIDIWSRVCARQSIRIRRTDIERLALIFELHSNPVRAARGAARFIAHCHAQGYHTGIISNAQFYTPLILESILGTSLYRRVFSPHMAFWSYQHERAKPDVYLFTLALHAAYKKWRIAPHQILYIGNDQQNDIIPANTVGMQTCLFYGDDRSLRLIDETGASPGALPTITTENYRALTASLGCL